MYFSYLEEGKPKKKATSPVFGYETDVIVAGLGTAGAMAAISAAGEGAGVIAFDRGKSAGGTATSGCVWDYYYGIPGGLGEKINAECREMMKKGYLETVGGNAKCSYPAAVTAFVLEKNLIESGCRLLYGTVPLGVYTDGNGIVGVCCFSGGEKINIRCRVLIDCTGDALLVRMAGGGVISGRNNDGKFIVCSNASTILLDGRLHNVWNHCSIENTCDSAVFSEVVLESASAPPILFDWYEGDRRTVCLSSVLGERGAPMIEADETLTLSAYAEGYRAENPLFYGFSQVDDPNFDIANSDEINQDWRLISALYFYGISLGIPLGTLLPKGLEGIAVACKSVGVDYDLLGCVRMRRNMEKCGTAAGVAAAAAAKKNCSLRALDRAVLQKRLAELGCFCEADNIGIGDLKDPVGKSYRSVALPKTLAEIRAGLECKQPKLAFWAVRTEKTDGLTEALMKWRNDENGTLRQNSVIALGLMGSKTVLPELRAIIEGGPEELPEPVYSAFCYQPYTAALCILGRLGDKGDARILMRAASNSAEYAAKMPIDGSAYFGARCDWEFLFFTLAVSSVLKIAARLHTDEFDPWLIGCEGGRKCLEECRGGVYKNSLSGLIKRYFDRKESKNEKNNCFIA